MHEGRREVLACERSLHGLLQMKKVREARVGSTRNDQEPSREGLVPQRCFRASSRLRTLSSRFGGAACASHALMLRSRAHRLAVRSSTAGSAPAAVRDPATMRVPAALAPLAHMWISVRPLRLAMHTWGCAVVVAGQPGCADSRRAPARRPHVSRWQAWSRGGPPEMRRPAGSFSTERHVLPQMVRRGAQSHPGHTDTAAGRQSSYAGKQASIGRAGAPLGRRRAAAQAQSGNHIEPRSYEKGLGSTRRHQEEIFEGARERRPSGDEEVWIQ